MSTKPTLKLVRAEIERFLSGTDPEVLCISGKWGVGKTFSWNSYLQSAKEKGEVGLKRYAYVSLFGLKSLEELKYALFESTKPTADIGEKLQWDDLDLREAENRNLKNIWSKFENRFRWISSRLLNLPAIQNSIGLTESILFYWVGKQLICIDDLERAGNGLTVKDVFGLVSFLRDQRKCKVVLLLNDEKIKEDEKGDFDTQFEKAVDTHLDFVPTPEEAAGIAFPEPEDFRKALHDHCITLGITNIRVIKKIEKICSRLGEILAEKYPELLHQTYHSAALFGWSKYQKDDQPPPFDFLKDFKRLSGLFRDKENPPENDVRWSALMKEYKFANVDDFDTAIYSVIDSGLYSREVLLTAAEKQSQGIAKDKQTQAISEAWDLYHDSFENNEKEVMDQIFKATAENAKVLSPSNLEGAVRTLKEFDRKEKAAELIKKYVEERGTEKEIFDLKHQPFGSDVKDPDVIKAFEEKLSAFVDTRNPADVLEGMIINRGWNPAEEELVSKLSEDDFYKIFKAEKKTRLHRVVKAALRLGQGNQDLTSITEKATNALIRIAKENKLNANRVAAQGIKLPEGAPDQQSPVEASPRTP